MSRFDECYASLENAKLEINQLEQENRKIDEIWRESLELCGQSEKYTPLDVLFQKYENKYKFERNFLIKMYLVCYAIAIIAGVILKVLTGNVFSFNVSPIISGCTISLLIVSKSPFKEMREAKRRKRILKKLLDYAKSFIEDENLSIFEIREKMLERARENDKMLTEKEEAIVEYQELLNNAQTDLANEILMEHGIDAQINLDAKIKEKNKSLIKINVNK